MAIVTDVSMVDQDYRYKKAEIGYADYYGWKHCFSVRPW